MVTKKKGRTDLLTNADVVRLVNRVLKRQDEMDKDISYLMNWIKYFQEVERPSAERPPK